MLKTLILLPEVSGEEVVGEPSLRTRVSVTPPGNGEQELGMSCQKRRIMSMNLETVSSERQYNEL